jgi:hypothetical protein
MSDKIYDELSTILRKSYENACILYIDRIVNPELLERFNAYKTKHNLTDTRLFHGTNTSSVKSICTDGYKASFNKRSAYGHGTYFSSKASYSKDYTDKTTSDESFMLVNRVCLGPGHNTNGQEIFVVKDDDSALPEYVICFHKGAKN